MNTGNYDSEATRFPESVDENTHYEGAPAPEKPRATPPAIHPEDAAKSVQSAAAQNKPEAKSAQPKKKSSTGANVAKNVAIGAGAGLLMGTAATFLTSMARANSADDAADADSVSSSDSSHPAWSDGEVKVATSVNDGMSFNEAFAAARAEVGPGGAFEWHGGVYGTYTAAEWNNMSAAEKAEYGDHFSWNNVGSHHTSASHHTSSSAHHSAPSHQPASQGETQQHSGENGGGGGSQSHEPKIGGKDEDIEVVSVNHNQNPGGNGHQPAQPTQPTQPTNNGGGGGSEGGDVEVIGVFHDDDTGYNIGVLNAHGHGAMMIDVDGDLKFDVMAVDINDNGEFEESEMAPIKENITVNDLGGFTNDAAPASEKGVGEQDDNIITVDDDDTDDTDSDSIDPQNDREGDTTDSLNVSEVEVNSVEDPSGEQRSVEEGIMEHNIVEISDEELYATESEPVDYDIDGLPAPGTGEEYGPDLTDYSSDDMLADGGIMDDSLDPMA